MITYMSGNLLDSKAEVLVNTVNTVGVMGKGIALMFKAKFPNNFQKYLRACQSKQIRTGSMFVTRENNGGTQWIVNFPTKKHWRYPSQMFWIVEGLKDLRNFLITHEIRSIALPPLGCGNGGLNWVEVHEYITLILGDLPDLDIYIFATPPR